MLTSLDLNTNKVGDGGTLALADALRANSTLTTLYLASNKVGDDGAQALAEALKVNSALTTLNLAANKIGVRGARALAEALKANSTLTNLDLGGNAIGDEGAVALAEGLKESSALTSLDLRKNSIGDDGARALLSAIEGRASPMEAFQLDVEKIGISLVERLCATVKDPGMLAERLKEMQRRHRRQTKAETRAGRAPGDGKSAERGRAPVHEAILESTAAQVENGRVIFKESKVDYGSAPYNLKDMFTFLEFSGTQTESAATFPEQWLPLLGRLVQDKTTSREVLAKEVLRKLCAYEEEESHDPPTPPYLSASVVAEAISSVAERKNYGVQRNGTGPQPLSIWRWEVRDLEATFPADVVQQIRTRRERRIKAQEELQGWLNALPEEKQEEVLELAKKAEVLPIGAATATLLGM
ncbi:hypothetical protein DFJ74DRAFT_667631 [Hyaloraphidium curvatum]|nr:hypothetical protein DFJ74DRAFT_667631 [Hyaloraphidium curvatum]